MKSSTYLLIIPFIFQSLMGISQETINKVLYINDNVSLQAYDFTKTYDTEFLLTGRYINDGLLIKFNEELDISWSKSVTIEENIIYLNSISRTLDSNYIIAGSSTNNSNIKEPFLLKLNESGEIIWSKAYSTSNNTTSIRSLEHCADSGFIIGGNHYTDQTRGYLAKINKGGTLEWMKSINIGDTLRPVVYSVKQAEDLGYYLCGYFWNLDNLTISRGFFMKITSSGEFDWGKEIYYSEDDYQFFYSVDFYQSDNSIYMIMGNYYKTFLGKLNLSGDILWAKSYNIPVPGTTQDGYAVQKLYRTDNNQFGFVSGEFFGDYLEVNENGEIISSSSMDLNPASFMKINNQYLFLGNGPLLGVKNTLSYKENIGLMITDEYGNSNCSYSISRNTQDENLIVNNITANLENIGSSSEIELTISNLEINTREGCVDVIGGFEELNQNQIEIYPNPANQIIQIASENMQNGILNIFSADGKLIKNYRSLSIPNQLDISDLKNGLYFYQYETDDNQSFNGKFTVLR